MKEQLLSLPPSAANSAESTKRKKLETWEGYLVSGVSGMFAGFLTSAVSRKVVL